jgi:predicted  nucleic acid-binding Zn-ribbon protein
MDINIVIAGGTLLFAVIGAVVGFAIKSSISGINQRFNSMENGISQRFNSWENNTNQKFDSIDKRFDKIDQRFDKVDQRFDNIEFELRDLREDIYGLSERMACLETEALFRNDCSTEENKRSEAAKKMWERRRSRRLLKHSPNKKN